MENLLKMFGRKSDKLAQEFRETGNEFYREKEFMRALENYNGSIAYCCSKKEICLSYGNRSAVYLEIGRYEECLNNIKLARENGYPRDKISKLNERAEKCKKKMEESPNAVNFWDYIKLSYPANEKIPWIADCVEMRWTQKYGRGIYATRDLKAGDIICLEKPICTSLPDSRYRHCQNCFKTNMMNLIPCTRTVSMFCSMECMNDFNVKTAGMEFSLDLDMKVLSEVAAPFGGFKKFDEFMKKTDLSQLNKTIFDFDFSDPNDPEYKKNLMTCYLSLASTNESQFMKSRIIFKYVSKKTADLLYGILRLNQFGIVYHDGGSRFCPGGSFISAFEGLLNHSCDPNVETSNVNDKTFVIVRKPIKAGEQLFISYAGHNEPDLAIYNEEKDKMEKRFNFTCDCETCVNNSYKHIPYHYLPTILFMDRKNVDFATVLFKEGWNYINNKSKSHDELFNHTSLNICIITTLAYFLTYPC